MAVKTLEMIRKIRDNFYLQTKNLTKEEQIKFIKEKAEKLEEEIKDYETTTTKEKVKTSIT